MEAEPPVSAGVVQGWRPRGEACPSAMPGKLKILIVGDSPVLPTGVAETTRLIFGNLLRVFPGAYDIRQVGLFHCYAVTDLLWPVQATALLEANGTGRFDPGDQYGQRTFPKVAAEFQPDIVFAFGDPQRFVHLCKPAVERKHHLVLYLNFDGLPLPPDFGPALNNADLLITKTEFAKDVVLRFLPAVDGAKVSNLYSPADIERFAPVSEAEKRDLREDLFPDWMPPDAFVLGWVGRNQWRKQIWLLYKAIACLRRGHYLVCRSCGRVSPLDWFPAGAGSPVADGLARESRPGADPRACAHCGSDDAPRAEPLNDVFLWLHTADEPIITWPLRWLEAQFGLRRDRDVYYTPDYGVKAALAPADVPMLYNIWDALLYPTGGEGFGLPAWEAMAAGIPAIYTNYSGHAELLRRGGAGLPVGGVLQPETGTCIWRMIADLGQLIEAVRRLYYDRQLGRSLGASGRAFVEGYSPEVVVRKWHEIFQGLAARPQVAGAAVLAL